MAADDRPRVRRPDGRRRAIARSAGAAPTLYPRGMPHAQLGGVHLHYVQHGSGDDVLLLCGLGDDHTAWDAQVQSFVRSLPADGRRQPRRRPVEPARRAVRRRRHGAGRRGAARPPRHRPRARRRLLDGWCNRPGARARPPRARPQPGPRRHLGARRPLRQRGLRELGLDGRRRRRRPLVHRGVPALVLRARPSTTTGASTPSSRRCWPTRTRRAPRRSSAAPARSRSTTRSTGSAASRRRPW